eukprot:IDg21602t1
MIRGSTEERRISMYGAFGTVLGLVFAPFSFLFRKCFPDVDGNQRRANALHTAILEFIEACSISAFVQISHIACINKRYIEITNVHFGIPQSVQPSTTLLNSKRDDECGAPDMT